MQALSAAVIEIALACQHILLLSFNLAANALSMGLSHNWYFETLENRESRIENASYELQDEKLPASPSLRSYYIGG